MGLFNKILQKIGIGKKDEAAASAVAKPTSASMSTHPKPTGASIPASSKPAAPAAKPVTSAAPAKPNHAIPYAPAAATASTESTAPKAISEVDVVAKLEEMGKGKKLDWKVSIVDLLKLLDLDSGFEARKELATELGCPSELMSDSAKMNVWLHKTVLKKIAENGGNIPQALLD